MVAVKSVKEFVEKNEKDLRSFSKHKTGIHDINLLDDQIQEFYVKLIKTRALETYDENLGSFRTYIVNLFCWTLNNLGKRNFRVRHKVISKVDRKTSDGRSVEEDVWNYVGFKDAHLKIDEKYINKRVLLSEEFKMSECFEDFKDYIRQTESEKYAYKMIYFLERKKQGCQSKDIAVGLGMSFAMVSRLKKKTLERFMEWQML